MRTITTTNHDYLAVIYIGGGSSWGRAPDKETAIKRAITSLRDWEVYFEVSNAKVGINVLDVTGYGDVVWGHDGFHGRRIGSEHDAHELIKSPIEHFERVTPKWKRRK